MSGGSFGNLHLRDDLSEIMQARESLLDMREALRRDHPSSKATQDTEQLVAALEQLEEAVRVGVERLAPVWRAVERERSGDSSRAATREAVEAYEHKEPAEAPEASSRTLATNAGDNGHMSRFETLKTHLAEVLHKHALWHDVGDHWLSVAGVVPVTTGMRVKRSHGVFVAQVIVSAISAPGDNGWVAVEQSNHFSRLCDAQYEAEDMLAARLAALVESVEGL